MTLVVCSNVAGQSGERKQWAQRFKFPAQVPSLPVEEVSSTPAGVPPHLPGYWPLHSVALAFSPQSEGTNPALPTTRDSCHKRQCSLSSGPLFPFTPITRVQSLQAPKVRYKVKPMRISVMLQQKRLQLSNLYRQKTRELVWEWILRMWDYSRRNITSGWTCWRELTEQRFSIECCTLQRGEQYRNGSDSLVGWLVGWLKPGPQGVSTFQGWARFSGRLYMLWISSTIWHCFSDGQDSLNPGIKGWKWDEPLTITSSDSLVKPCFLFPWLYALLAWQVLVPEEECFHHRHSDSTKL